MTTTWPISTYPLALDTFTPALLDGVDEVLANHQNVPAQALVAVQTKLGIDGSPVTGLGGVSFDPAGKAAFPGVAGSPTIWVNNTAPSFSLMYTDELGFDFTLVTTVSGTLQAAYNAGNTIVTSAARNLDISGTEKIYLASSNVGADAIKLTALGGIDIDATTPGINILASGASGCDLSIGTNSGGTGNITISASGSTGGVVNISATGGAPSLTLSCTSGVTTLSSSGNNVAVTSGAVLDMDGVSVTLDSATTLSLDSTDNSNFTITANSDANKTLTISATNSGDGNGYITINTDYLNMTSVTETRVSCTSSIFLYSSAASFYLEGATTGHITTVDTLYLSSSAGDMEISTGYSSRTRVYAGTPGVPGTSSYLSLDVGAAGANGTAYLYSKDISLLTAIAAGNRVYINTYDFSCIADNSISIFTIRLGSPVTIDSAGVLELNSSTDVISIGNDAVSKAINIGNGASARPITIGNNNTTTSISLISGTGGISLSSTSTVLVDAVGVLELNSSAGVISIGNDAVAQNINIGTGAAARTITVGNVTGATSLVLNSGTGGVSLTSTGAGDILLNSSDTVLIDAVGVLELNSSAGVISIGNDAVAQNVNIGTGAAARTITIGNNTTTTALSLVSGTGNIYLDGGVKLKTTTVNAATYTTTSLDSVVLVTYSATGLCTVTISSTEIAKAGRFFYIIDSGGNARTNNITIETQGAETISGEVNAVINEDYGCITLMSDGTNLIVV